MATQAKLFKAKKLKIKSKFSTRVYNRCNNCGRSGAYFRQFGICRICLRKLAHEGLLPGVTRFNY